MKPREVYNGECSELVKNLGQKARKIMGGSALNKAADRGRPACSDPPLIIKMQRGSVMKLTRT